MTVLTWRPQSCHRSQRCNSWRAFFALRGHAWCLQRDTRPTIEAYFIEPSLRNLDLACYRGGEGLLVKQCGPNEAKKAHNCSFHKGKKSQSWTSLKFFEGCILVLVLQHHSRDVRLGHCVFVCTHRVYLPEPVSAPPLHIQQETSQHCRGHCPSGNPLLQHTALETEIHIKVLGLKYQFSSSSPVPYIYNLSPHCRTK